MALSPDLYSDLYKDNGEKRIDPQFPQAQWKKQLDLEKQQKRQAAITPAPTPSSTGPETKTAPTPLWQRRMSPLAGNQMSPTPLVEPENQNPTETAPRVQAQDITQSSALPEAALYRQSRADISGPTKEDLAPSEESAETLPEADNINESQTETATDLSTHAQTQEQGVIAALSPKRQLTAGLLKWSWLTLIPSFGLTLIYLDIHFLGAYLVRSKLFCKFGQEWLPINIPNASVNKGVEIVEIIVFILVNIVIACLIAVIGMAIAAPFIFIYSFFDSFSGFLKYIGL